MNSVNTNIAALTAQKSMSDQVAKSEQAIERLSSGLRINHAADDAAVRSGLPLDAPARGCVSMETTHTHELVQVQQPAIECGVCLCGVSV